ncbi:MAG: hypothetical protein ACLTSX_13845 [Collinsella sp.]
MRGYADDLDSTLNPLVLPEDERPGVHNTDTYDLISAASATVLCTRPAASDSTEVCYVDPNHQEP